MKKVLKGASVLLPSNSVDLQKWAVVACDQFTSEPEYWKQLETEIGDNPSMLNVIFPEVYLSENNAPRIAKINKTMHEYIAGGVFQSPKNGLILTVRSTPHTTRRVGLVGMIDLDCYSYEAGNTALIRATEGTILDRIPPRVQIRENSPIESPHIMLLIDDRECNVIQPIFEARESLEKLYDFELNMGGGHIQGYLLEDTRQVQCGLKKLISKKVLKEKYQSEDQFLFAVGDGNHSLATAKTCWENLKKTLPKKQRKNHVARFALVEIVNIFDDGLKFEPIHRVVFDAKPEFLRGLLPLLQGEGKGVIITGNEEKEISLPQMAADSVKLLQDYIDDAIKEGLCSGVDYVHGADSLRQVVNAHRGSVGILLEAMDKNHLFLSVKKNGVLPRKTFSMGEAKEKRYYLECRYIQN